MREGIYRLYRNYVDEKAQTQRRQVARFVLYGDSLSALEDHDGLVEQLVPDGKVTTNILQRLELMEHSPYWSLVHEDDVQGGEHEDLLPEMNDGMPGQWSSTEGG
jgi:hypothetical protein